MTSMSNGYGCTEINMEYERIVEDYTDIMRRAYSAADIGTMRLLDVDQCIQRHTTK